MSLRVAIPGVWIECCGGRSLSNVTSDGDSVSGLVAENSDVVLVLNETEGAMAGCPAILAGNLLLQAVQIRVHGPGELSVMYESRRHIFSESFLHCHMLSR